MSDDKRYEYDPLVLEGAEAAEVHNWEAQIHQDEKQLSEQRRRVQDKRKKVEKARAQISMYKRLVKRNEKAMSEQSRQQP